MPLRVSQMPLRVSQMPLRVSLFVIPQGSAVVPAVTLGSPRKHPPEVAFSVPNVGCSLPVNPQIISPRRRQSRSKGVPTMIQDVILALVFLVMIIAPSLLAMRADKEEQDSL
jgi:hypothetical protein